MSSYLQKAYAILDRVEESGGFLSQDEEEQVRWYLQKARANDAAIKNLKNPPYNPLLEGGGGNIPAGGIDDPYSAGRPLTPGEVFINSSGYKAILNPSSRPTQFSTGLIEISSTPFFQGQGYQVKGTALEGSGAPGSGSAGGLVPIPDLVPGIVQKFFQPLTIEQLSSSQQVSTNIARYIVEGTATGGQLAGGTTLAVAEAGTKPESTVALSTVDEPIKKLATVVTVSDELLEDAPAVQAYVNGRLSFFVQQEAERQIFRGAAGGNEVQGILTSRSVPVYNGGTADNKAIQLFKAANSMRGSAFIEPEWIVVHPTDYQIIRLLTDTAGQLFGGGPFLGPYGQANAAGANPALAGANDRLWGLPVYVSANVGGAGTALIGTSANARVFNRGGISVEATNSHSNYFVQNLVALRCERRLGLGVFHAGGFVEARLAVGPGG